MIFAYARVHNIMEMRRVYAEMMCYPRVNPNVFIFDIMINALKEVNLFECAISIYKEMEWLCVKPDASTFDLMIDVFGKTGQIEKAFALIHRKDFEPFSDTLTSLINALRVEGTLEWSVEYCIVNGVDVVESVLNSIKQGDRLSISPEIAKSTIEALITARNVLINNRSNARS